MFFFAACFTGAKGNLIFAPELRIKNKIYQAEAIHLGDGRIIKNGYIELDESGKIIHLGENIQQGSTAHYLKGIICPGFVNSHCHLELSHLHDQINRGTHLSGFISEIFEKRESKKESILAAAAAADKQMIKNGIVAVGDISNGSDCFQIKAKSSIHYHNLIELFGLDKSMANDHLTRGKLLKKKANELGMTASLSPHAPYSLSPDLFKKIVEEEQESIFSIHNQETEDENSLFLNGKGNLLEQFENKGFDLSALKNKGVNSIHYHLPFFPESNTVILVHNTYSTRSDIEWSTKRHANLYWCFCPKANDFIEKRLPDLNAFLKLDIRGIIGTDSLASNSSLDILSEMRLIQEKFEEVTIDQLIPMACWNGASAFSLQDRFGVLEIGRKPGINWIKNLKPSGRIGADASIEVLG